MAYYDDLTYKRAEIKKYLNDRVKELKEYDKDGYETLVKDGDLHNEIFNTDYYIIGYYNCEKWLGNRAFDVIGYIKDYENDNFGEVTTDLSSSESVVNMYVYIIGQQILQEVIKEVKNKLADK